MCSIAHLSKVLCTCPSHNSSLPQSIYRPHLEGSGQVQARLRWAQQEAQTCQQSVTQCNDSCRHGTGSKVTFMELESSFLPASLTDLSELDMSVAFVKPCEWSVSLASTIWQ